MDYPAATLNYLTAKKKWYVYVPVPAELRDKFGRADLRRSTGAADKKAAERKLHEIAASIYAEFDKHKSNPKLDWLKVAAKHFQILKGHDVNWQALPDNQESLNEVLDLVRTKLEFVQAFPSDIESAELVDNLIEQLDALESPLAHFKSGQPTFAILAQTYIEQTNFTREQAKKQTIQATNEFSAFLGLNKLLAEIVARDLYAYAEHLSTTIGLAKSTIRGRIDRVSLVFHEAVRKGVIPTNPCIGLRLIGFGKEREHYKAFTKQELTSLFALDLPPQERLVLELLAMSGMRLDEVALLIWDELTEEDGIRLFDLTKRPALRKNKESLRKIPLHQSISLPKRGAPAQRLFDYTLNSDGKTTYASEKLMKYVRQVTDDPLKVVHSLRHNFKDAMRDMGVSKEISDFISGHSSGDVAGGYGRGPSMKTRYEAISKLPSLW